jgi:prepilin-type N-terminal cleavage/methylation domain-containing protein
MKILLSKKGFSLMEVLVATAITGIALGIALSGISLGHRQTFRGKLALEAASIAEVVLMENKEKLSTFSTIAGDVNGYPGWTYKIEFKEIFVDGVEVPELKEMTLSIFPFEKESPFIFTAWLSISSETTTSPSEVESRWGIPSGSSMVRGRQ